MPATYEALGTTTSYGLVSSISLTNISQAYTDLILICQSKLGNGTTTQDSNIQINGLSSNIYSDVRFYNVGSGGSGYDASGLMTAARTSLTSFPGMSYEIKIFPNYTNTSINKTMLSFYGCGITSSDAYVGRWSSVARTTAAITRIDMVSGQGRGWASGTTVTLYGIKAA